MEMMTSFLVGAEQEEDIDSIIDLEKVLETFNWQGIRATDYEIVDCYEVDTEQKPAIYLPHPNKKKKNV